MTEAEPIPAEMAVAIREQPQSLTLFGASEPVEVIQKATQIATALRSVVERQGLISVISGKKYPRCEAWTLLGTMLGVFPVLQWSKQVEGGWEARVEARTRDGAIVGAAEAQCLRSESNWAKRDDFALRSMAQTRATAKALRMPLGFVMTLGGLEPTPAEEMAFEQSKPTKVNPPKAKPAPAAPEKEATPEQKTKFLTMLAPVKQAALQYAIDRAWILPTEGLDAIPLSAVPTTQKQFQGIMDGIRLLMDGQPEEATLDPMDGDLDDPQGDPTEFEISKPDEAWRSLIVPFGKNKGETFGSLEKGQLWWWCVKWQPEDYTGKDGKTYPPKKSDLELRSILDEVRKQYQFTDTKKG